MRQFRHLTPRYVFDRLNEKRFRRAQGRGCPNLASQAVEFLASWLGTTDRMLEFGAGASTKWFGERVGSLVSVENNPIWFARVSEQTAALRNVEVHLFDGTPEPETTGGEVAGQVTGGYLDYLGFARSLPGESFTVVLNDGWVRFDVALEAVRLLKSGGLLVWDDTSSRTLRSSSLSEVHAFLRLVTAWRHVDFNDGVHPTALFFKP